MKTKRSILLLLSILFRAAISLPTSLNNRSNRDSDTSSSSTTSRDLNADFVDVVIIGAGWAGLTAAKFLLQQRPQTTIVILEANDYIGGRSRSVSMGDDDETVSVDLGSQWIDYHTYKWNYGPDYDDAYYEDYYADCRDENIYDILINLKDMCPLAEELNYGDELRGDSGHALWDQYFEDYGKLADQQKDIVMDKLWTGEDGYIVFEEEQYDAAMISGIDKNLEDVLTEYEESIQATPLQKSYLDMTTATEMTQRYGEDLEDMSLLTTRTKAINLIQFTDDFYYDNYGSFYTYEKRTSLGGNFGKLVNEFANCEGLLGNVAQYVRLNSEVQRVEYNNEINGNKVAKTTYLKPKPNGEQVEKIIFSRAVISTVSLGVLKANSIEFDPPLPESKVEVIDEMTFAVLDKWVGFWKNDTDVPWDDRINDNINLSMILREEGAAYDEFMSFFNSYPSNGHHKVMAGFMAGSGAIEMENQPNEVVHERAMHSLGKMFPSSSVPEPSEYLVTRWSQEPNFRGSYTSATTGRDLNDDSDELFQPVDNLFFAGESTASSWQGTASGAYNSGEAVASAVYTSIFQTED